MNKVIVKENQSIFDIALQEYGYVEAANAIAQANNISISEYMYAGLILLLPIIDIDTKVKAVINIKGISTKDSSTEGEFDSNDFSNDFKI